jgi:hypothetical protein
MDDALTDCALTGDAPAQDMLAFRSTHSPAAILIFARRADPQPDCLTRIGVSIFPDLVQDLAGVLAEGGRGEVCGHGFAVDHDRGADAGNRSGFGKLA